MQLPPVIFEDESLVVFDKPGGMLVAPESRGKRRENLQEVLREKYGRTIANVHRLDTETSGLLLWAKTKEALDFLSGQFQAKTAVQVYHAVVVIASPDRPSSDLPAVRDAAGTLPATFTVDHWLGHDYAHPERVKAFARNGGKPALTEFVVKERFGRFAVVECRPQTARMHQVRVHLASAGAPVLNDALYGDPEAVLLLSDIKRGYKGGDEEKPMIRQLALHAGELTVVHPVSREPLVLHSPLPQELVIALKNLRKFVSMRRR